MVPSPFLSAQSSSRSLVVGRLVGLSVIFVKRWPLGYQKVIRTCLPTFLWDSSDSSDSSDQETLFAGILFLQFFFFIFIFFLPRNFFHKKNWKTQMVIKLKNSNFDETQKLILWWNSKTQIVIKLKIQIVIKLKNSKCEETQKLKLW